MVDLSTEPPLYEGTSSLSTRPLNYISSLYEEAADNELSEPLLASVDNNELYDPSTDVGNSSVEPTNTQTKKEHSTRILDREGLFSQSRGRFRVKESERRVSSPGRSRSRSAVRRIIPLYTRRCWDDWFHSLAYTPTLSLMTYLFLWYTGTIFFWAALYLLFSKYGHYVVDGNTVTNSMPIHALLLDDKSFCGMDIANHMDALYFSLSTMTTIGYGVSDYYFGGCWAPFLLVLAQVFSAITFDAVAIGLLFQRISRGQKRGRTIIFSDKAVVRRVRGQLYFMLRVGELRKHHVIEAHVRIYCVRHERYPVEDDYDQTSLLTTGVDISSLTNGTIMPPKNGDHQITSTNGHCSTASLETSHFVTRPVRVMSPDENTGAHLLMSLPHVLVHKLDATSPLFPPQPVWYDEQGQPHSSFSTSQKKDESHVTLSEREIEANRFRFEQDEVCRFLKDREAELIVLLEGTDEMTGMPLQARHSYRWDDILYGYTFSPCIFSYSDYVRRRRIQQRNTPIGVFGLFCGSRNHFMNEEDDNIEQTTTTTRQTRPLATSNTTCLVDFGKFHDVVPAPLNCKWSPHVPDHGRG